MRMSDCSSDGCSSDLRGIRCNTVSPGVIKTEKSIATMTDEQFATIEKHKLTPYLGRPDDIAHAAVYLASDDSRFVTAQLLCVDGGITAHPPTDRKRVVQVTSMQVRVKHGGSRD